jgi:hypothetical protein
MYPAAYHFSKSDASHPDSYRDTVKFYSAAQWPYIQTTIEIFFLLKPFTVKHFSVSTIYSFQKDLAVNISPLSLRPA